MCRVIKIITIITAIFLAVSLAILPFVVPPLVEKIATDKLAELGFPSQAAMKLRYSWNKGPKILGSLSLHLLGTDWSINSDFGAGFGEWHANVTLPETTFTEREPTIVQLLQQHPISSISNLIFSSKVALTASVERTREMPVPCWKIKAPININHISLVTEDINVSASNIRLTPGATGIATHIDIDPMFIRANSLTYDNITLTNMFAVLRASEKGLFISEAKAEFCNGQVCLYSLYLDHKSLNTGMTLFLDEIDAGEALSYFNGFEGRASGRLHGKLRLFIKEGGKAVRLSNAYLYSTPGEIGKLKMHDSSAITDNLALAGIDDSTRNNVSIALGDLDYSVLKLNLHKLQGNSATLSLKIEGNSDIKGVKIPVNLNININGELEQLINTGLDYSSRLKGKIQ